MSVIDARAINMDRVLEAVQADELIGICAECGEESEDNVEPDARRYKCSACGLLAVYGAEELLLSAM